MLSVAVFIDEPKHLDWQQQVIKELVSFFRHEVDEIQIYMPTFQGGWVKLLSDLKQQSVRLDMLIVPGFSEVDGSLLFDALRSVGMPPLLALIVVGGHPRQEQLVHELWCQACQKWVPHQQVIVTHDLEVALLEMREQIVLYVRGS